MAQERHHSNPPPEREPVERFVRVTLGCKCPDEVFRSIVIDRIGAGDARGIGVEFVRLTIGGRLLIYVLEAHDPGAASSTGVAHDSPELVAALTRVGLAERDAQGFSRFRLVVASASPLRLPRVTQPFTSVAGTDEQAHLHLVDTSELPVELRRH